MAIALYLRSLAYHRKKHFSRKHRMLYFTLPHNACLCSRLDKKNSLILKYPTRLRLMQAICYWEEVLAKRLAHFTSYQELQLWALLVYVAYYLHYRQQNHFPLTDCWQTVRATSQNAEEYLVLHYYLTRPAEPKVAGASPQIKLASFESTPHFFERSTEFAAYSWCQPGVSQKIGVFQTNFRFTLGSENSVFIFQLLHAL